MWDLSQHGNTTAASNSTAAGPAFEFGVDDGRLPYLVAMAVSIFGGLCVLVALSQERPAVAAKPAGVPAAKAEGDGGLNSGLLAS